MCRNVGSIGWHQRTYRYHEISQDYPFKKMFFLGNNSFVPVPVSIFFVTNTGTVLYLQPYLAEQRVVFLFIYDTGI
jgi:hypothetical protein